MSGTLNRRDLVKLFGFSSLGVFGLGYLPSCKQKYEGNPWWNQFNWRRIEKEISSSDFKIHGTIPKSLNGTYIRNGANNKNKDSTHYFVGDGMLHSLSFENGIPKQYHNRWVRTTVLEEDGPGLQLDKNESNTSVIYHGGKILSLNEAGLPYQVGNSLATSGAYSYEEQLKSAMTAHPKIDPVTQEMFFFGVSPVDKPYLHYYVADRNGQIVKHEPITLPAASMMHDFQLTENFVIFIDMPIVFDLGLAIAQQFPFKWKPQNGARIGVMPRYGDASELRWFDIETCFMFHTINAYEDDNGSIVLEGSRMNSMWEKDVFDIYSLPFPYRWTVDLKTGAVDELLLDDQTADFGRVDPRFAGRKTESSFVMPTTPSHIEDGPSALKGVRRYSRQSMSHSSYIYPDHLWPDEHLFIPKDKDAKEGSGWLTGFVYNENTDSSHFSILDSDRLSDGPVAQIDLPQRVPFGFHGTFIDGMIF